MRTSPGGSRFPSGAFSGALSVARMLQHARCIATAGFAAAMLTSTSYAAISEQARFASAQLGTITKREVLPPNQPGPAHVPSEASNTGVPEGAQTGSSPEGTGGAQLPAHPQPGQAAVVDQPLQRQAAFGLVASLEAGLEASDVGQIGDTDVGQSAGGSDGLNPGAKAPQTASCKSDAPSWAAGSSPTAAAPDLGGSAGGSTQPGLRKPMGPAWQFCVQSSNTAPSFRGPSIPLSYAGVGASSEHEVVPAEAGTACDRTCVRKQWPPRQFAFAMMFSGYMPQAPELLRLRQRLPAIRVPSLHCFGSACQDWQVDMAASLDLSEWFCHSEVLHVVKQHAAGHMVPSTRADADDYITFLDSVC